MKSTQQLSRDAGRIFYLKTVYCFLCLLILGDAAIAQNASYQANSIPVAGTNNAAFGYNALHVNTGDYNVAVGFSALFSNTTGLQNSALGYNSLLLNSAGKGNTAIGLEAMHFNTTGNYNTASGVYALNRNTTGYSNVAMGTNTQTQNTTGYENTALGKEALYYNTTGNRNIALGYRAGFNFTTGSNNIAIGNEGVAAEANVIRIGSQQTRTFVAGINGTILASGVNVFVNASGQLGILPSSIVYKENILALDESANDILKLRPVSFTYKDEVSGGDRSLQYGLIAEDVARVNRNLVLFNSDGTAYTVKYHMLVPMLVVAAQRSAAENRLLKEQLGDLQSQLNELKKLVERKFNSD